MVVSGQSAQAAAASSMATKGTSMDFVNEPNDLASKIDRQAEAGMGIESRSAGQEPGDDQEQRDPGLDEDEEEEEEEEEVEGAEADMLQDGPSNQLEHDMYESESPSESGTDSLTWISWFCSLPGHEYFAEVSEDFIEDDFNLTGLNALVPFYKEALEMILDVEPQEDSLKIPDVSIVESSAELLYGLIHQRYILTRQGLQQMAHKYERGEFGFCPRVFCHSHPVLPCGRSDLPGLDTVKLFCANCVDNYSPPSSRFHGVDGAFFGTTFPHLLFQTYRDLAPSPIAPPGTNFASLNTQTPNQVGVTQRNGAVQPATSGDGENDVIQQQAESAPLPGTSEEAPSQSTLQPLLLGQRPPQARLYTPRIYGFRVSEYAKSGPRMRWLRMRPESFEELDQCLVRTELYPTATASIGGNASKHAGRTDEEGRAKMGEEYVQSNSTVTGVGDGAQQQQHSPQHGITTAGRSTATGRPIAGRAPSAQAAAEAVSGVTEGI